MTQPGGWVIAGAVTVTVRRTGGTVMARRSRLPGVSVTVTVSVI